MSLAIAKTWSQAPAFVPTVSLENQPLLAGILLVTGILFAGMFSMTDKKGLSGLFKQTLFAIPASVSIGFGFVYLLCSVGVYV
ncbi:hypothetical protein V1512DRAFT_263126 [Lipomyces arxii]|uniref:uncharacterized protein n=1 Tax=Lipomyces arxii TaxID=56418 RepID=UPI0034CECFEA